MTYVMYILIILLKQKLKNRSLTISEKTEIFHLDIDKNFLSDIILPLMKEFKLIHIFNPDQNYYSESLYYISTF